MADERLRGNHEIYKIEDLMKIKNVFILLILPISLFSYRAVEYSLHDSGRLGDKLIHYLHCLWISQVYNIPIVYQPFDYSLLLNLSVSSRNYSKNKFMRKTGNKRKSKLEYVEPNGILEIGRNLPPPSDDDDMLLIYFFPEIPSEIKHFPMRFPTLFSVDWKSPEFRALAMEMVSPIEKISLIYPPNDSVSIALHIRDGGASDPYNKEAGEGASKLPPFGFYPKGLRTVLELFPNKKIYCFVFTDSHTPGIYVEMLKNAVPETERITFEFHREVCGETHNVLQDLFSFFNFDVLIRPDSHFSMVPSLLHDFAVLYAPTDFSWETLAIETQTVIDEEKYRRLLQEKADSF